MVEKLKDDRLKVEMLLLVEKLELYLARPSNDGRPDRKALRELLRQQLNTVKPLLED